MGQSLAMLTWQRLLVRGAKGTGEKRETDRPDLTEVKSCAAAKGAVGRVTRQPAEGRKRFKSYI